MSGLALRAPIGRGVDPAPVHRGLPSRPRFGLPTRRAWALGALPAAAAAAIAATLQDLPAFESEPSVPWWVIALLFAIAESVVLHVHVGGSVAPVVLRGTPLLLGIFFLPPIELIVAHAVGVTVALLVRHPPTAWAGVHMVAMGAFGTAAAAAVFRLLAAVDLDSPLDWWGAASAAALIVAAASIVSRPSVGSAADSRRTGTAHLAVLIPTCVLAVVDASLGMAVVVHARNDPAELWLLAGPTAIAILAYRAYGSLRRRQAGLEFLFESARILEGPATGEAMLKALVLRTRDMFHAESAEIIVDDGSGSSLRTTVGRFEAGESLVPVPAEVLRRRLGVIPCGTGGTLIHPGTRLEPRGSAAHLEVERGVLAHFQGPRRVRGTILVADRTDGSGFDAHDLRLLEALAGNVGTAMGNSHVIDELAASLADVTHLAALVSSTNDAIIAFTLEKVVTSWNAAAEALFGHPASEIVGGFATGLVPPDRVADLAAAFARACAGSQVSDLHVDARRRDGTLVPISATVSPIRNAGGEVTGVSVIARDETERTLQESALRQSADRFRSVFDGSSVGMGVIGADLRWVRINEALCRTLGMTEGALAGRRFERQVHRDDVGAAHGLVSRLLRGEIAGSTIEIRIHPSAAERVVTARFTVRQLRDGDGTTQALCMVEDVTERRLAEERARAMESRLHHAVLDLTAVREPDAVIRATLRAARDVIDAEAAAMVGLGGDEGEPATVVVDDEVNPGWVGLVLRKDPGTAISAAAAGPVRLSSAGEGGVATSAAGMPLPGPLRSYLAVPIRFEDRLLATLHIGNKRQHEPFTDADVEVATVLAAQAGISLENARIHQQALTLVKDLDEANTSLQHASETRSRLLASVSHELRTPLHSILMAAQLVRESGLEQGGSRRVRGLGETIEGSGRHLLGLIDDFLDLSRIEVGAFEIRPTPILLAPLLRDVRRDMAPLASEKGIGLSVAEVPGLTVLADPLRIRQVLLNLVSNALKFTPRGGRVRISTGAADDRVQLSVHDTGIGIASENLERAFVPFEQVSGTDTPGVGLGLAISRRIAELHGGTLTAVSAIGQGSTFTLTLAAQGATDLPIDITRQVGSRGDPDAPVAAAR